MAAAAQVHASTGLRVHQLGVRLLELTRRNRGNYPGLAPSTYMFFFPSSPAQFPRPSPRLRPPLLVHTPPVMTLTAHKTLAVVASVVPRGIDAFHARAQKPLLLQLRVAHRCKVLGQQLGGHAYDRLLQRWLKCQNATGKGRAEGTRPGVQQLRFNEFKKYAYVRGHICTRRGCASKMP